MNEELVPQSFVEELHHVLRHLYEPAELRRSHLLERFEIGQRSDGVAALRSLLLNTIQSLKPDPKVQIHSSGWRIYQVLNFRFVDQASQKDVATELSLSVRQLRRLEKTAVQALAEILNNRYPGSTQSPVKSVTSKGSSAPSTSLSPEIEINNAIQEEDFEWLKKTYPVGELDLCNLLAGLIQMVEPLGNSRGVKFRCEIASGVSVVIAQVITLKQALMNILAAALASAPQGEVRFQITSDNQGISLAINAIPGLHQATTESSEVDFNLKQAANLVKLSGGELEVAQGDTLGNGLAARLVLPIPYQFPVLVVDDNGDTLRLLERYLSGSKYRFLGVQDPLVTIETVVEAKPRLIVIDLMMPNIDGWELLGYLRQHPQTSGIPVVVCSIMRQEALALALGAAAFLIKPVSREVLLATLDRLIHSTVPG